MKKLSALIVSILVMVSLVIGCEFVRAKQSDYYTGDPRPVAPRLSIDSIGRAKMGGGFGGTVFLLETEAGKFVVGAGHVLKNARDNLTLFSRIEELAVSTKAVQPPKGFSGDVMAFEVSQAAPEATSFSLATEPPAVGDLLWVVELKGPKRSPKGVKTVRSKVTDYSASSMLLEPEVRTPGDWTSGAPVINQSGEVVGINVGWRSNSDGSFRRTCVPWEPLHKLLTK
jgi:Trypsin-like peptidase domain